MLENVIFLSFVYIVIIILLVVLIYYCIKGLAVIDQVNASLDELNKSVHELDYSFDIINRISLGLQKFNKKYLVSFNERLKRMIRFGRDDTNE